VAANLQVEATSATVPDVAANLQVSGLVQRLTRSREALQYGGRNGIRIEATYATPEYVAAAFPADVAARFLSDQFTAFLLTERLHIADLPGSLPDVALSLYGQTYKPDLVEEVTASPHHRVTLVRFPAEPPSGLRHRVMELSLPGDAVITWHLPISYAGLESRSGLGVTWVWLLAVLGGLVAAMWPCLFQLTVFFIPALGGLNMHEASGSVSLGRRASVVKAAFFFVLGFTVVYTAAGALIGSIAGRLGDMSGFYTWQRYLGIAGGFVILLLALRVATQVRAPLVCKMPVLSRMGQRKRPANPFEMMVAGVAFATGCMTCFGAAIVVAMVVYVGLSGSALIGGFTLFLFSMGMGIPLVIAAMAMSKVLPVLSRFEQAIRWVGLASSLVMVGFAVLLITGNYMVLTEWIYSTIPGAGLR
jgi:cytochrome c-type biogenesis protein